MTITFTGQCTCGSLRYSVDLESPDAARTSLCHCSSCRRAFGTNFGLTTKVPLEGFRYVEGSPKKYVQKENGVTREFCETCGVFICEYGPQASQSARYVMWGTMDDPMMVPPKGEFFCKNRVEWMPEIPGVFHKKEIEK